MNARQLFDSPSFKKELAMQTISLAFLFSIATTVVAQDATRTLAKKLGDKNFPVREKTQKEIFEKMDYKFLVRLAMINKEDPDAEVSSRIDRLIESYQKVQSEYKVDLKGYKAFPFIDEGMPANYKLDGAWRGWERMHFIRVYVRRANDAGALQFGHPHWLNYRKATEIWMQERIDYCLKEAIAICKDEDDFERIMKKHMERIGQDIEMLIEGDNDYYKKHNMANPVGR